MSLQMTHFCSFLWLSNTPLWASLVAQMVKHLPAMQKTQVRSLGQEDPLEKEMAPSPVLLPGKCTVSSLSIPLLMDL